MLPALRTDSAAAFVSLPADEFPGASPRIQFKLGGLGVRDGLGARRETTASP